MTKFQIKPSQPQPLHNEKEETESKNPYGELSVIELESIVGGWGGWPWPWPQPEARQLEWRLEPWPQPEPLKVKIFEP
jgi:hypothetical protein